MAIKQCVICGKEFVDYGRGKYCPGPHYKSCVICGREFEYDVRSQYQPSTCSRKCAAKLIRQKASYSEKLCAKCNTLFKPNSSKQKYCEKCKM